MTSQQKYLFISDWQDPRIADEIYESDDDHLRENDDVDFYRLMVRGETVGYFPPMTAVHVQRGVYGSVLYEYYLPPMKYWEELEYRYNKMLPDEMEYRMQQDITHLAWDFSLYVAEAPNWKSFKTEHWEVLDSKQGIEWNYWHLLTENPGSRVVYRMCAPRLPEKRRAKQMQYEEELFS